MVYIWVEFLYRICTDSDTMVFRCRGLVGSITRHTRGRGRTRRRDVGSTTELGRNRTENEAEAGNVTGM